MRLIPVDYAREKFLAEDIYDLNSKVLLKRGVKVTDNYIEKIKLNSISTVYVNDQFSEGYIDPLIPNELKYSMVSIIKKLFTELRRTYEIDKRVVASKDSLIYLNKLLGMADDVIYELTARRKSYIDFTDIKASENYTYEHCVNVGILAFMLAKNSNINANRLKDVFIGSLIHDIGMAYIDESIFMKHGKLDVNEFVKIKQHTTHGYNLIKDLDFSNSYTKVIVYQHHEKLDGTGYPNKLKEDEINEYAKLTSVVDVFDAMTSDRPYAKSVNASKAIEYLMGSAGRHLDYNFANTFIKKIMPYPEGTMLKLNNNQIGVVKEVNESYPLRPKLIILDKVKKIITNHELDLTKENSLIVDSIVYDL